MGEVYDFDPTGDLARPAARPDRATAESEGKAVRRQTTLGQAFERAGRGLHTGSPASVRVCPAPAGHGIVFRRVLPGGRAVDVPAHWRFRESQPLCTALRSDDGVRVRTIEHLSAALGAMRVDNALICLDAEELPIFDGSAVAWCDGILEAGLHRFEVPRRFIKVLRPVEVRVRHRLLRIEPYAGLHIRAHLALRHFGPMNWSGTIDPDVFRAEIAPARSFGRYGRAMLGRAYGVATRKPFLRGVGPASAALLVRGAVVGGMRLPREPVRHRVLDLIGDLSLAGHPIHGRITAEHTGHELNHALVNALMDRSDAWTLSHEDEVDLPDPIE